MRVIAGEHRSRRLVAVPPGVRPTSDRVREALFASLGDIQGSCVLDLYAGTGSLGIEALSRGARKAVFVDRSKASLEAIEQNVSRLRLDGRSRVLRLDARTALTRLEATRESFDLVFLDPPYDSTQIAEMLAALAGTAAVGVGAQVVVETATRENVAVISGLRLVFERSYGKSRITRFQKG